MKWGLLVLLSSYSFAAHANPPVVVWRIAFKNGSNAVVRFAYDSPLIRHHLERGDPLAPVTAKTAGLPFTEAVVDMCAIESEMPTRSAVVRMPALGAHAKAQSWMMDGLLYSLAELYKRPGLTINLTVVVDSGFSAEAIEALVAREGMRGVSPIAERAEIVGPSRPGLRDWSAMPQVAPVPLLTAPLGEALPLEIGEEILRVLREVDARTQMFEEGALLSSAREMDALVQTARTLSRESQRVLREELAKIREACMGQVELPHDLVGEIERALAKAIKHHQSAKCDRNLRQAS